MFAINKHICFAYDVRLPSSTLSLIESVISFLKKIYTKEREQSTKGELSRRKGYSDLAVLTFQSAPCPFPRPFVGSVKSPTAEVKANLLLQGSTKQDANASKCNLLPMEKKKKRNMQAVTCLLSGY